MKALVSRASKAFPLAALLIMVAALYTTASAHAQEPETDLERQRSEALAELKAVDPSFTVPATLPPIDVTRTTAMPEGPATAEVSQGQAADVCISDHDGRQVHCLGDTPPVPTLPRRAVSGCSGKGVWDSVLDSEPVPVFRVEALMQHQCSGSVAYSCSVTLRILLADTWWVTEAKHARVAAIGIPCVAGTSTREIHASRMKVVFRAKMVLFDGTVWGPPTNFCRGGSGTPVGTCRLAVNFTVPSSGIVTWD